MRTYKGYFKNLDDPEDTSFEPHPTNYPVTKLEYPNNDACESFILLTPKDKNHYDPIMCLELSLHAIIKSYLTPAQQSLFGTFPDAMFSDTSSPTPSPPSSSIDLPQDASTENSTLPVPPVTDSDRPDHLKLFQRALRRRDGLLFQKTMTDINHLLRTLKYPPLPTDPFASSPNNIFRETVKTWTSGIPYDVLTRIIDETYQRSVGPHVHTLNRYSAFSSEVYGELMPSLTSEIISLTGINTNSLLIDLGSGVGNVVMQASLQSGCRSFGIELMQAPAKIAKEQLQQFKTRCRMWGVSMGEVELEEGDMLTSARVTELLPQADVVLVNNKVFLQSLNEALRPRFLDLKEGAIVVSLKPFVSSLNARVTERNVDDISAIFEVVERQYRSGGVSWGSNSGCYYLHRVDRAGYAGIRQRFEESRARSSRSRR
ncbi:hypothetical protein SERLA73DRAFT_188615 [Serpula lacrymans var. lacrymans S7.3]|uniref:Histone-lysine N-methyltransferase, H3 lysine-79 specific n=2 Tax=Serpula lacrymans var. lacrymans TaxID=341189 RepID=F8QBU1_SERL3|nr:uncharacterized protein SERLADRAFT_478945 [Serpula lacrymans var. lacrymans S7.9]EGN94060.1 hypothetical protein SERLA73DRAFT_188615 [Serpula lacrymans var. lacrymans S7.3]EGO19477.1 hypothetical protein SERLADRAFT_478945 [Serpula lacrymans var. lacrymans S7.9]